MAAMDRGMRRSRRETHWQVDFQALDRRECLIINWMLAGLGLGMVLGLVGESLAEALPASVAAVYDPYAYGLLVLVMTRAAASAAWAALNGLLTAAGLMAGHMVAHALNHDATLLSKPDESWQAALSITVIGFGALGYLSRRRDLAGDVAVGLVGGLMFTEGARDIQQAASLPHGGVQPGGPWTLTALMVMGLSFPLLLRATTSARLRTMIITLACAVVFTVLSLLRLLW